VTWEWKYNDTVYTIIPDYCAECILPDRWKRQEVNKVYMKPVRFSLEFLLFCFSLIVKKISVNSNWIMLVSSDT